MAPLITPLQGRRSSCDTITDIASVLRLWCNGESGPACINQLARVAARIAEKKLYGRLRAAAAREGVRVGDLALSSVAGLFRRNGSVPYLTAALGDDLDGDDVTLFRAFEAIVVVSVSQHLFHQWKTNDPNSAKLWEAMQRVLRNDRRVIRFPHESPEWVTVAADGDIREDAAPWAEDELLCLALQTPSVGMRMGEFVYELLTQVAQTDDKQRAVKIDVLFAAMREATNQHLSFDLASRLQPSHQDVEWKLIVDDTIQQVRTEVATKINRYVAEGKMTEASAKQFDQALRDFLDDFGVYGEPAKQFLEYLQVYAPDLGKKEYLSELRGRFEYLARFAQQRFFVILRENYCHEFGSSAG